MSPEEVTIAEAYADVITKIISPEVIKAVKAEQVRSRATWTYQFLKGIQEGFWMPRARAVDLKEDSPAAFVMMWRNMSFVVAAKKGFLKERTGSDLPVFVQDAFLSMIQMTQTTSNFVGRHSAAEHVQRYLRNRKFQAAVEAKFKQGELILSEMQKHLVAYKGLSYKEADEKVIRRLISKSHVGVLGLKPHIVVMQTASYVMAGTQIPWRFLVQALVTPGDVSPEIQQTSSSISLRNKGSGTRIVSPSEADVSLESFYNVKGDRVLKGINSMDRRVIHRLWKAVKLWGQSQGLKEQQLMEWTRDITEKVVNETQPQWSPLERSGLSRDAQTSVLWRLLTVFSSQTNQNFNIHWRATDDFFHSPKSARDYSDYLGKVSASLTAHAMVYAIRNSWRAVVGGLGIAAGKATYQFITEGGVDKELSDEMIAIAKDKFARPYFGMFKTVLGDWLVARDVIESIAEGFLLERDERYGRTGTLIEALLDNAVASAQAFGDAMRGLLTEEEITSGVYAGRKRWELFAIKALEKAGRVYGLVSGVPVAGALNLAQPIFSEWIPSLDIRQKNRGYYYKMYNEALYDDPNDVDRVTARYAKRKLVELGAGWDDIIRSSKNYRRKEAHKAHPRLRSLLP